MLKREKKRAAQAEAAAKLANPSYAATPGTPSPPPTPKTHGESTGDSGVQSATSSRESSVHVASLSSVTAQAAQSRDLTQAQNEAFKVYRRDHPSAANNERMKKDLKIRCEQAKSVGADVGSTRTQINRLKRQLEQHRVSLAVQGVVEGGDGLAWKDDPEEASIRQALEQEKLKYKNLIDQLKKLKAEVDHLKHLLHKSQIMMMNDFLEWWNSQSQHTSTAHMSTKSRHRDAITPHGNPPEPHLQQSMYLSRPTLAAKFPKSPSRPSSSASRHGHVRGSISQWPQLSDASRAEGSPLDTSHRRTPRGEVGSSSSHQSLTGREALAQSSSSAYSSQTSLSSSSSSRPSSRRSLLQQEQTPWRIALTGDSQADADIKAFMEAGQALRQRLGNA